MTKDHYHVFLICLLNSVAFFMAVCTPNIIDPLLPSRSRVYSSQYPLGHWTLLLLVPVFALTYLSNTKISSALKKSVFVGLSLILPTLVSLPNFDPIPHEWVLQASLGFAFLISCISFVHNYKLKHEFINDEKIDIRGKIERLKLEHENWYRILFLFVVGVSGLSAFTVFSATKNYEYFYSPITTQEKMIVGTSSLISSAFFFILMLVLTKEILSKMACISESLIEIKCVKRDGAEEHKSEVSSVNRD